MMGGTDQKNYSINITASSIFKGILIILLIWFLFFIKDIVLVVLVSIVIASGVELIIKWFKIFKIKRLPAAIIAYLLAISLIGFLIFSFVPSILNEASEFLSELPAYFNSTTLWNPLGVSGSSVEGPQKVVQGIQDGVNTTGEIFKNSSSIGISDLVRSIQSLTASAGDGALKILSAIFGGLLSLVLIIVLSFYFIVQENGVEKFLSLITPIKHEPYVLDLWKRTEVKIGRWIQGQMLLGVIVAILVYLGLLILGIKNALLIAVLTGVLEIIPVFGPIMASIPAIINGFIGGGVTLALLVAGLYMIIQQFESHLIYPLVIKKVTGISPIIVILALIIGAKLAGFLGLLLSVPIVTAIMEFLDDIEKKKHLFKNNESANSN